MRITITVEELKVKIKNIRTTYNREATKVAKSKKSGAGTDDIYKPQLNWFSTADRFLKPVIDGRSSKDNMGKESEDSAVNTNSDASSYFDELGQGSNTEPAEKKKKFLSPKKRTERAQKKDPPVLEAVGRLESLAQSIRHDEFDTFGQHVANQLRGLPLANAIICQNFIITYLSQERLNNINSHQTPRPLSSLSDTRYTSTPEPSTSRHLSTSRLFTTNTRKFWTTRRSERRYSISSC